MHITGEQIPKEMYEQWKVILLKTGGKLSSVPKECGQVFSVNYTPGNFTAQCKEWGIITKEKSNPKWEALRKPNSKKGE